MSEEYELCEDHVVDTVVKCGRDVNRFKPATAEELHAMRDPFLFLHCLHCDNTEGLPITQLRRDFSGFVIYFAESAPDYAFYRCRNCLDKVHQDVEVSYGQGTEMESEQKYMESRLGEIPIQDFNDLELRVAMAREDGFVCIQWRYPPEGQRKHRVGKSLLGICSGELSVIPDYATDLNAVRRVVEPLMPRHKYEILGIIRCLLAQDMNVEPLNEDLTAEAAFADAKTTCEAYLRWKLQEETESGAGGAPTK